MSSSATCSVAPNRRHLTWTEKVNGPWHKYALWVYTAIVLAHWAEHLAQTTQIYLLGWPVPESRSILGLWFPWLVKSESLHYASTDGDRDVLHVSGAG